MVAAAVAATVAMCAIAYGLQKWSNHLDQKFNDLRFHNEMQEEQKKKKQRYVEDNFPGTDKDLKNHPDWEEITHPDQKQAGHREFENGKTGEKVGFDKGKPNTIGHRAEDHYHRYNPSTAGRDDLYLDKDGNPVHKNDDRSHLYPPEGIYWDF